MPAVANGRFEAVFFDHVKGKLYAVAPDRTTWERAPGDQWRQRGTLKAEFAIEDWIRRREEWVPPAGMPYRYERHSLSNIRSLPTMRTLERWAFDSVVEATDECEVEPDGICEHGFKSWFLVMGVM